MTYSISNTPPTGPGYPPSPKRSQSDLIQLDGQLLQVVDEALADTVRRAGHHLVCRPGCTQCCYGAFSIDALDALRLREAMQTMREGEPERAARIEQRTHTYLAQFGSEFPGDIKTGILGVSPEEQAAFEEFANDAACPALDPETGLCELYAARPMTCRVFGPPIRISEVDEDPAYSVCELCFTEASPEEIADCAMEVPQAQAEWLAKESTAALPDHDPLRSGETIVAFCLIQP